MTEVETSVNGVVADDGAVYMTGLPAKGTLKINWGIEDDQSCSTVYDISTMDLTQPILQFELGCQE